jgi:hypothetical protein
MKGNKRLRVKFTLKGSTVTAQVMEMPESLRGKQCVAKDRLYRVESWCSPEVNGSRLYVRGQNRTTDNTPDSCDYGCPRDAKAAVAGFRRLIAKINAGLAKKGKVSA